MTVIGATPDELRAAPRAVAGMKTVSANIDLNFMSGGYDIGYFANNGGVRFAKSVIREQGNVFHAKPLIVQGVSDYGTALVEDSSGNALTIASAASSPFFKIERNGKIGHANPQKVMAAVIGDKAYVEETSPILRRKRYYTIDSKKFAALYL